MRALVIGGTRNLGPSIVAGLAERGYEVTVFHRGRTRTALPESVREVFGDRGDAEQLRAAAGAGFDAVIDTTLYNGADARAAAEIFRGRAGRYVMISTGQVYLVRTGIDRPFREEDYEGPTMPPPGDLG